MIIPVSTRFLIVLFGLALAAILTAEHTLYAAEKSPVSILVLGDSLSGAYGINLDRGWVALLQKKLGDEGYDHNVINASVSGDTTRTGLGRIGSALEVHRPEIVIIALGGNDGLRGLAFSEIESSLAAIIERCHKNGASVLLVGVRLPPNYGPAYNKQFAALYRGLAERYNVPLVPRMLDGVAERRELMQEDNMHPNEAAQSKIMHNVWVGLEPLLKQLIVRKAVNS